MCEPRKVALQSGILRRCFVDVVKRLLEAIGGFQAGKGVEPCFNSQGIAFVEVMSALQEQVPIVHQRPAASLIQAKTELFTDGFQVFREHFQDVTFVYDEVGMWQCQVYHVMIDFPHVGANDGDLIFDRWWQALQVLHQSRLIPVSKPINDAMMLDIANDTTRFVQQVDLVNADAGTTRCRVGFYSSVRLAKDAANGTLVNADIISNAREGSSERLLDKREDQALCQTVMFVHVMKGLKEGFVAGAALIPPSDHNDPGALASDGNIHKLLGLGSVFVQEMIATMWAARSHRFRLRGDAVVVCALLNRQNVPMGPTGDVQRPLILAQNITR